ncbi:MAG: metallophosphoesterase [Deltaproteobacteria bacterium]|jgi:predicted MPP superfamily phosphohydrolase|nr:metallophosphoesterase [Deltaproteobacteria bacterium]
MFIFAGLVLIFSAFFVPFAFGRLAGWPKRVWPFQLLALALIVGYLGLVASRVFIEPNVIGAVAYDFLGLFFIFQVYFLGWMLFSWLIFVVAKSIDRARAKREPANRIKRKKSRAMAKYRKKVLARAKSPTSWSRILALAGLALCLGLVVYGAVRARFFEVTRYEIPLAGLEKPVTVVHAPDLHLGNSRGKAYLESVLEAIKAEAPDLVFYNGDLVDSKLALRKDVFDLFKSVPAEQYFTTGNHEYYVGTDLVIDWVKQAGIKVLRSERVITHGIQFVGLEYMNADRQSTDAHQVNQLAMDEELPKITLSPYFPLVVVHHSPVGVQYVQEAGALAMLTGHTHGGQLFPGTLMIKSRFPMFKGRYQAGPTAVLVSQGAGTFGPMMRLGTRNEIQVIKFVPAPKAG